MPCLIDQRLKLLIILLQWGDKDIVIKWAKKQIGKLGIVAIVHVRIPREKRTILTIRYGLSGCQDFITQGTRKIHEVKAYVILHIIDPPPASNHPSPTDVSFTEIFFVLKRAKYWSHWFCLFFLKVVEELVSIRACVSMLVCVVLWVWRGGGCDIIDI